LSRPSSRSSTIPISKTAQLTEAVTLAEVRQTPQRGQIPGEASPGGPRRGQLKARLRHLANQVDDRSRRRPASLTAPGKQGNASPMASIEHPPSALVPTVLRGNEAMPHPLPFSPVCPNLAPCPITTAATDSSSPTHAWCRTCWRGSCTRTGWPSWTSPLWSRCRAASSARTLNLEAAVDRFEWLASDCFADGY